MTTLTDPMVADVCRRAGFSGDELVRAISTALATSGGVPAYDHPIYPGPVAHYRGLWGLDTVERPQYADHDLADPQEAAHVAHELTVAHGWEWSPAWRAGTDRYYDDRARAVVSVLPARERMIDPVTVGISRRRARDALDELGARVNLLTTRHHGG